MTTLIPSNGKQALKAHFDKVFTEHPLVYGVYLHLKNPLFILHAFIWALRVAEYLIIPAMFLAILWIVNKDTFASLDAELLNTLNDWAMRILNSGAELVLPGCIVSAVTYFRNSGKQAGWVFGLLYTGLAIAFLILTIMMINGFESHDSHGDNSLTRIRLIVGFVYIIVWSIALVVKNKDHEEEDDQGTVAQNQPAQPDPQVAQLVAHVQTIDADRQAMANQLRAMSQQIAQQSTAIAQATVAPATTIDPEAIAPLFDQVAELRAMFEKAMQLSEPRATGYQVTEEREQLPVTASLPARSTQQRSLPQKATGYERSAEATSEEPGLAQWEQLLTDTDRKFITAPSEHRERIYRAMVWAMGQGLTLSYNEIASVSQTGYSTVKKHAPKIREELSSVEAEPTPDTDELPIVDAAPAMASLTEVE